MPKGIRQAFSVLEIKYEAWNQHGCVKNKVFCVHNEKAEATSDHAPLRFLMGLAHERRQQKRKSQKLLLP